MLLEILPSWILVCVCGGGGGGHRGSFPPNPLTPPPPLKVKLLASLNILTRNDANQVATYVDVVCDF